MPDNVLSQAEVDALMKAVDSGEVEVKKAKAGPKKNCTKYDFKNPNLIPKESMRIIKAVQENFARSFSQSLSGTLRYPIQMTLVSIDQLTYGEFLLSLPEILCLNIIRLEPFKGHIIIEMNLNLILAFIDRLLGGEGKEEKKVRVLTELEQVIMGKILRQMLEDYRESWKQIIDFHPKIENIQSDPRVIQIARENESVVLVCFEIKYGKISGLINMCFPSLIFELLISKLNTSFKREEIKTINQKATGMQESLVKLPLALTMIIDKIGLKVEDVLNLQKGDILQLNRKAGSDIKVMLDRWHLYNAKLCSKNKKKAVIVTKNFLIR